MTPQDGQQYLASIDIRRRLLKAVPDEPGIGYLELSKIIGISGAEFDGGLLELEALGVIKKIQTRDLAFYCKVSFG